MNRSTASQGSRRDARPASDRWPRVGATLEGATLVVRELAPGEKPSLPSAVRIAEPCERHRTLTEALQHAAASLAHSLREKAEGRIPVRNALAV